MPTQISGFVIRLSTGQPEPYGIVYARSMDGLDGGYAIADDHGYARISGLVDKTWVGITKSATFYFVPSVERWEHDDIHNRSSVREAHDFAHLRGKCLPSMMGSPGRTYGLPLIADGGGGVMFGAAAAATGSFSTIVCPGPSNIEADSASDYLYLEEGTGIDIVGTPSTDTISIAVVPNTTNQKVEVMKAAASVGTRKTVNFIEGSNVTLTIADDGTNDRVNLTIAASGGVTSHALLDGSVHTDTVAQSPTRGSIVYANATPKWDELLKGATGRFLKAGDDDISWVELAGTDILSGVVPADHLGTGTDITTKYLRGDNTWQTLPAGYTDENAQDAIGAMINSTLVYTDATPLLERAAITGDVSVPLTSNTATLATVNANVGSFGSATQVAAFTVNAKGLITAASNTSIAIASTAVSDFTEAAQDAVGGMVNSTLVYTDATPLLERAAITGDVSVPLTSNTATLATVNSNVGSFGSATQVAAFTVNAKGLITAASNTSIAIASTAVSDFAEAAQDAVGAMVNSTLVYTDATPLLERAAITGDVSVPLTSNTATLATVNSNVGSFGSASQVAGFTVNAKGLITAASNTSISIASTAVSDFTEAAQDAVGAMVDSTLVYTDATPALARAAISGEVTIPTGSNTAAVNIHGTTVESVVDNDDEIMVYDTSAAANRRFTRPNFLGSVDGHTDVDTSTDAPVKNEVLKWNGTKWVPAMYSDSFIFTIASFDDGISGTTQIIGTGDWKAAGALDCTATYNNGPPTTYDIQQSTNGGAWSTIGTMDAPNYTSGDNDAAIAYPSKDQYLTFRLNAASGSETDIETEVNIYFRNYRFWGVGTKSSGYTETDIEALSSELSNSTSFSKTINSGSGQYIVIAYPAGYTAMDVGDDYEDHGTPDFLFNGVSASFILDSNTLHIVNSKSYDEHYQVYVSTSANLGNYTLTAAPGASEPTNYIYWGELNKASGYTSGDVTGNYTHDGKVASNTIDGRVCQVHCAAGEYAYIAYPARKPALTGIWVNGINSLSDFNVDTTTLSITNENGWSENYRVYVSVNHSLTDPTDMTLDY